MPEAHALMGWWQSAGATAQLASLSVSGMGGGGGKPARRIVFSDIDEQALGLNSEPDHFSVRCTVTHVKSDQKTLWYIACPQCKKKLVGADDLALQGHCEKCDRTMTGTRRWIFVATCNDTTGSRLISFFDNEGTVLLGGKTADELATLREQNAVAFDQHFLASSFKAYTLKARVKNDYYNDEAKLRISATQLTPIDFVSESRSLLQEIQALRAA